VWVNQQNVPKVSLSLELATRFRTSFFDKSTIRSYESTLYITAVRTIACLNPLKRQQLSGISSLNLSTLRTTAIKQLFSPYLTFAVF